MKKTILLMCSFIFIAVIFLGGMYVYVNKDKLFEPPKTLSENLPDISNDNEAITPESFAEMEKGVIYEITEEEKEFYLDYAKALYEEYKHVGVAQKEGGSSGNKIYYQIREDVQRRKNEKPEDMLNSDGSLKHPEAFTGFVISNRHYAFDYAVPGRDDSWTSPKTNVNRKANAFLLTEEFYLTYNNGNEKNYSEEECLFVIPSSEEWKESTLESLNFSVDNPNGQNTLILKMINAGFFDTENKYTNKIFEMLAAGDWNSNIRVQNAYDIAATWMFDPAGESIVDGLENIPEKYNIVNKLPDENVTYFYPTKVWKIDNNTVVVDICIVNGDMLDPIDTNEIVAKIVQSNTTKEISYYSSDGSIDQKDDYVVYARYFFEDLTQGVFPDGGVSIVNYGTADSWNLVDGMGSGLGGYTYVFNEKAKDVLRGYWGTVAKKLETGEKIDTQAILKVVAKEEGIPYKDALNIWATYLVSHISEKDAFNNSQYRVTDIPNE